MKPSVAITNWVHPEVIEYLQTWFAVIPNATREPLTRQELMRRGRDAYAMMVFMPDSIDDDLLAACPSLGIVSAALKGYDNYDVDACTRRGIWFSIVPDLLTVPTAELTIALMIALGRNMHAGDRLVRSGDFRGWRPELYGHGLSGRRIGIIGMGAVGQAVTRRLVAFDAEVVYFDSRRLDQDDELKLQVTYSDFSSLLATSDYVVPLVPLTIQTLHMINDQAIASMKPGAFLINAGRGSVVDEAAVAEAIMNDHLGGYAADVFEMEDWARPDRPKCIPKPLLSDHANTVFTPHLGSAVHDIRRAIAMEAARNIVQAYCGERPDGAINLIESPSQEIRSASCSR